MDGSGPLMSPGQLPRHYAPKARLLVLEWATEAGLLEQMARHGAAVEQTCVVAHTCLPGIGKWLDVSMIPHDPEAFARALYAELHRCDERQAAWVVVERTPVGGAWRAIADRLDRAAADAGAQ
jgi:L-threonylcarbamoyladenylate synthase